MSSNQKRGFRLPWGAERPDEGAAATLDSALRAAQTGGWRDDLGEGPFRLADAAQDPTTGAAPAAADVPDETPEAAMIDPEAPPTESAAAPPDQHVESGGTWPASDRRGADRPFAGDRLANRAESEPRMPRRDNPLVAGLVKAMREAAVASRAETTAAVEAEVTARVEAIRARATTEAAGLRERADEDVSAIREWSKAEIARVRQETEDRIAARKAELTGEAERHAASVDRLVDEVQATVAGFEVDMDQFFERLLAENDPARLATLAEQAPDPPDLRGDGPPATDMDPSDHAPVAESAVEVEDGLQADAAAEAEAEATEGLELSTAESWPAAVKAAARRGGDPVATPAEPNGPDATRLLVRGLTSVAGISAFKGALGQLPGVRSVSVSSGERGVFVFAVNHDPGVDLDPGVSSLHGFSARITDATDDGFTVVANEPAA